MSSGWQTASLYTKIGVLFISSSCTTKNRRDKAHRGTHTHTRWERWRWSGEKERKGTKMEMKKGKKAAATATMKQQQQLFDYGSDAVLSTCCRIRVWLRHHLWGGVIWARARSSFSALWLCVSVANWMLVNGKDFELVSCFFFQFHRMIFYSMINISR